MKRRVLFVVENVTLAQVVRLATLARGLDPNRYDVHFASSHFDPLIFRGADFARWRIHSITKEASDEAVRSGKRPWSRDTLEAYVEEEIRLFEEVEPDLVVGDLRLSLAVSAPTVGVPHAALINAYWSPLSDRESFPLPDHPIVRLVGESIASRFFPIAQPFVFEHFARPLNQVRKSYGLPPVGSLLEALNHGDHTLFPDIPALCPLRSVPTNHHYLGPVLWSPDVPMPAWWDELDPNRPIIYVTLGSSGNVSLIPVLLSAMGGLDATVLLATAGRHDPKSLPENVRAVDFLPGDVASRRASLVISNGGSSTGYQALYEGTPVLGIPWNLDQYLASAAIDRTGAGRSIRAGALSPKALRALVEAMIRDEGPRRSARAMASELRRFDAKQRFEAFLQEALGHAVGDRVVA